MSPFVHQSSPRNYIFTRRSACPQLATPFLSYHWRYTLLLSGGIRDEVISCPKSRPCFDVFKPLMFLGRVGAPKFLTCILKKHDHRRTCGELWWRSVKRHFRLGSETLTNKQRQQNRLAYDRSARRADGAAINYHMMSCEIFWPMALVWMNSCTWYSNRFETKYIGFYSSFFFGLVNVYWNNSKRVFSALNDNLQCLSSEELVEDVRTCQGSAEGVCGCVSQMRHYVYRKFATFVL